MIVLIVLLYKRQATYVWRFMQSRHLNSSMSTARVTIHSLPVELFSAILANVPTDADDKRDLRSCSLVSRAWRQLALSFLFASVTMIICDTEKPTPGWMEEVGLEPVTHFVRSAPHLCAHVHALRLTTMRPIYPQSDWFAPYVAVSLDPDALAACLLGFPALRTFHTVGIAVLRPPSPSAPTLASRTLKQVLVNVRLHPSAQAAYQRAGAAGVDQPVDVAPLLAVFRGTTVRELRLSGPVDFALFFDKEKNALLQTLGIVTLDLSHPRIRVTPDVLDADMRAVATLRTLQLGLDSIGEFEAMGAIAPRLFPGLTHLVCRAAVMAYNFSPLPPPPDFSSLPSLARLTLRDVVVDGDSLTKVAVMLRHFLAGRAPLRTVHLDLVSGYVYSAREPAQVRLAVNELEAVLVLLHRRRSLRRVECELDVSAWADAEKAARFAREIFEKVREAGVEVVKNVSLSA